MSTKFRRNLVLGCLTLLVVATSLPKQAQVRSQCPVEPDKLALFQWLMSGSDADPPDPDSFEKFELVVYQGDMEVGRVYRDVAGPKYTEHWVLYPEFRFDSAMRSGQSMRIETVASEGYEDVKDFFARVPFPDGSRYVIADCVEYSQLPVSR